MKLLDSMTKQEGLYTLREAAMFARMHPMTLQNWLYGNKSIHALRPSKISKDEGKFLTFVEFVEALAISDLRVNYNIPLQTIRTAIDEAKKVHHIDYPFASRSHKTFRCGRELYIAFEDGQPIGLTGKEKRQKTFKPCLEAYMDDLDFDTDGMASKYTAYRDGGNVIQMKPSIFFGTPMVEGCGYSAETLWNAAKAEGSAVLAAQHYGVEENIVHTCCRYWGSLQKAA